ncbi:MAG: DNRLRE domain-containing protein [Phycisphaeraceae bacterium]|nr:DNRLRE domain-containing protein [Phycisphaerales bacterium]QOJ18031.1 MAG: DNRLRE domain-containing protein [Phycisphaeraceae bacterium]
MQNQGFMTSAIAAALLAGQAPADTVHIGAMRDNTLFFHAEGAISNGAGQHFFAGVNSQNNLRRGLLAFDIVGAVPAGATITGVSLTLHLSSANPAPRMMTLHRILTAWGEGASDAPGEEGNGAPAQPGDATWRHTFHDTQFWTTPGGDFDAAASGGLLVGDVGFYTWSSVLGNPGMVVDVQQWLDNPALNHGWLLRGDESTTSTAKRFDTREHPTTEFRPVLTVEYTIPAPATGVLLLAGLVAPRRRRSVA